MSNIEFNNIPYINDYMKGFFSIDPDNKVLIYDFLRGYDRNNRDVDLFSLGYSKHYFETPEINKWDGRFESDPFNKFLTEIFLKLESKSTKYIIYLPMFNYHKGLEVIEAIQFHQPEFLIQTNCSLKEFMMVFNDLIGMLCIDDNEMMVSNESLDILAFVNNPEYVVIYER